MMAAGRIMDEELQQQSVEGLRIGGQPFLGQVKARTMLSRSLASGRLAHGYLFRGPDGVGKKLLARGLAAAINCRQRQGLSGCGLCSSCKKAK